LISLPRLFRHRGAAHGDAHLPVSAIITGRAVLFVIINFPTNLAD
jgi:hypothetical protein